MTLYEFWKQSVIGKKVKVIGGQKVGQIGIISAIGVHGVIAKLEDGSTQWFWMNNLELLDDEDSDPLPLPG